MRSLLHLVYVGLFLGMNAARPAPVPAQTTGILSDDFNTCQLSPLWTVIDPVGGATVALEGTGTADARLVINVPGGTSHDPWINANQSVRVMQPAPDSDFEIQARFDSRPTTSFQGQGLLVEQDAARFLRFDMEYGNGVTYLYSATLTPTSATQRRLQVVAGSASTWLGLKRTGSTWTLTYSQDGVTWLPHTAFSYTLAVSGVGFFGSNYAAGSAPAYTVKVDYFLNLAAPFPAGEDQSTAGPSTTLTRSVVGNGSIYASPDLPLYYCGPVVTVTAIPASGWTFQGWSGDLGGTSAQQKVIMTSTRSITATFVPGPVQTGLVSDDFNTCSLNSALWSVVDPVGGAGVAVEDPGTSDARLVIGVPGGASHDLWTDGNHSVRIMQVCPNTDFEVQARFDSRPTTAFQGTGLLVEQSAGSFLRFDLEYGNGTNFLYSATITPTSATQRRYQPLAATPSTWLGISRLGNQWNLSYSQDGSTWLTHTSFGYPMTVGSVGVFGGNYATGSAPAYTTRIDYFLNPAAPFASGEDQGPPGPATTLTRSISGSGSIAVNPDRLAYYCGSVVTLTAVPAAGWVFQGWGGDLNGTALQQTLAMTASRTITAAFAPAPPQSLVVYGINVATSPTAATVTWQTDRPASSRVDYGPSSAYELGALSDPAMVISHAITLNALSSGATYHYRAVSVDIAGQAGDSGDLMFTTPDTPVGIFSDDFNRCAMDSRWSVVDPLGGGRVRLAGMGTADAVLQIDVPGGPSHDWWTDANHTVRLVQPAPNGDFEIQARFQSQFTSPYQTQGLLIEQEPGRFLRFDVDYDGRPYVFAAGISGGTATFRGMTYIGSGSPVWLGIQRVADQWTMRYSLNGTNWNLFTTFADAIVVNRIGVAAGNYLAGTAPPFTALVDYFLNPALPFAGEDMVLVGGGTARTLTRTVAAGQGTLVRDPGAAAYYCDDLVTLTPRQAPGWAFAGWSGDYTTSDIPLLVTMSANRSVAARFFRIPFTRLVVDANNPAEPHCKEVGDINGDGLPDIIIASGQNDGVYWYEAPGWTKYVIRSSGYYDDDLHAIDIDGDGDLDIVVPLGVSWYENPRPSGDPRTRNWTEHLIGAVTNGRDDAHDLELGDMDQDGRWDVVIRPDDGGNNIFFQNTPNSWALVAISTVSGHGTAVGDVDGDGDLDIAGNGYWLENPGGAAARTAGWVQHTVDANAPRFCGALVADINQDGRPDITISAGEGPDGPLAWYEAADPRGTWTRHIIDPLVDGMHTFKAGDMDGDGDLDIITAEMHQGSTRRVGVYFNLGEGLNWSQEVLATTGSHNIRVADMDKDGDLDIVGANWSNTSPDTGDITLWRNELIPLH